MLSLYVDSAARDDVEPLLEVGIFRGITTNPPILDRWFVRQGHSRRLPVGCRSRGAGSLYPDLGRYRRRTREARS